MTVSVGSLAVASAVERIPSIRRTCDETAWCWNIAALALTGSIDNRGIDAKLITVDVAFTRAGFFVPDKVCGAVTFFLDAGLNFAGAAVFVEARTSRAVHVVSVKEALALAGVLVPNIVVT